MPLREIFRILHLKLCYLVLSVWHFVRRCLWDVAIVTPGSLAKWADIGLII